MIDRAELTRRYQLVRRRTLDLAAPLSPEDMGVQSMPDASPTKWHLAHTTWFFDEFVLARHDGGRAAPREEWAVLYNSYYEAAGERHARHARGVLSRPTLEEVLAWRGRVDERMLDWIARAPADRLDVALLGTHHEEQHQELLLTDIQHAFSENPLLPAYARQGGPRPQDGLRPMAWRRYEETVATIGAPADGFAFDNERPRHRVIVGPFSLATRAVTNSEYARFVEDGGYDRPGLWLSDGWSTVKSSGWRAPLYWRRRGSEWWTFTLRGLEPIDADAPVAHVSFYEADAYARWAEARLPTEGEWERAAAGESVNGHFVESARFVPAAAAGDSPLAQLFGDVWEWTASAYGPYPRFTALPGALGEYNGKFMSGQMVLRGGSCLSPREHLRHSYRNFFPPHARWQMTGLRLARD
ncbi:MAG TPA: ergothioneine biosynthesis protein EgtB [Polyangiaceae bacterium]|nr:ergothioneine biosynthesis protein EgtB [Polyangiaceae bacterium]